MRSPKDLREYAFTFGRYQPITVGHIEHFKSVRLHAAIRGCDYSIFGSTKQNNSTDPLPFSAKQHIAKMAGFELKPLPGVSNVFQLMQTEFLCGYDIVHYLAGDDYSTGTAKSDMERLVAFAHKSGINLKVTSSGARKPGLSASELREAAMAVDFQRFSEGFPIGVGEITEQYAYAVFLSIKSACAAGSGKVVNKRGSNN